MIAGYESVLDLIGQLCSGSRHRALGVSFICLEMVLRRRRLYDLVIDPAANVDVTRDSTYIRDRGLSILAAAIDSSCLGHPMAMAMRTTPAPNHPVEIIELQFSTFLASLRTGDARAFHANMVFIESLSTTAYTTKEWTAQNGSFRFSTKHDALQRVFRLPFAFFSRVQANLCLHLLQ